MFTVTSKLQYDKLKQEQCRLSFDEMCKNNTMNTLAKSIENFEAEAGGDEKKLKQIKSEASYRYLVAAEDAIEVEIDNIDAQLEMLEDEIKNYEQGIQDGIEQSTTFWCFGN